MTNLAHPGSANNLLDALIQRMCLKNDAALARALSIAPPVISKIRHGRLDVGATLLIRMHEVSGLGIRNLKLLGGFPAAAHYSVTAESDKAQQA